MTWKKIKKAACHGWIWTQIDGNPNAQVPRKLRKSQGKPMETEPRRGSPGAVGCCHGREPRPRNPRNRYTYSYCTVIPWFIRVVFKKINDILLVILCFFRFFLQVAGVPVVMRISLTNPGVTFPIDPQCGLLQYLGLYYEMLRFWRSNLVSSLLNKHTNLYGCGSTLASWKGWLPCWTLRN